MSVTSWLLVRENPHVARISAYAVRDRTVRQAQPRPLDSEAIRPGVRWARALLLRQQKVYIMVLMRAVAATLTL